MEKLFGKATALGGTQLFVYILDKLFLIPLATSLCIFYSRNDGKGDTQASYTSHNTQHKLARRLVSFFIHSAAIL